MLTSPGARGETVTSSIADTAGRLTKPIRQSELGAAVLGALKGNAATPGEAHTPLPPGPTPLRKLNVLVAEDNQVNQLVIRRLLEKRGHAVALAGNGREALRALSEETFDLVLMDVQMPEMDGIEATAAIRKEEYTTGRHQRIIAMTAHAMKDDADRCLAAGMDEYLSKPIQLQRLAELLRDSEAKAPPSAAPAIAALPYRLAPGPRIGEIHGMSGDRAYAPSPELAGRAPKDEPRPGQ
jgi:CheY-like chemotaxis protein